MKHLILFQLSLLGLCLFLFNNYGFVVGQILQEVSDTVPSNTTKMETNSLNLSGPIYQAVTGTFLATKEVSSSPYIVTEESFFEEAVMKNVGNVTNNMTFTNTYLLEGLIQGKGKGTIVTSDGHIISWISSDIGLINNTGPLFHGIILFDSTDSEKLSFLNNSWGVYKETPEMHRTIWLVEK
jgi:hypothetical protein